MPKPKKPKENNNNFTCTENQNVSSQLSVIRNLWITHTPNIIAHIHRTKQAHTRHHVSIPTTKQLIFSSNQQQYVPPHIHTCENTHPPPQHIHTAASFTSKLYNRAGARTHSAVPIEWTEREENGRSVNKIDERKTVQCPYENVHHSGARVHRESRISLAIGWLTVAHCNQLSLSK